MEPAELEAIKHRQQAVRELQHQVELREKVSLIGKSSFREARWETVVEWLESPAAHVSAAVRRTAGVSSALLATLALLGATSVVAWAHLVPFIAMLLALHAAIGVIYRRRVRASLPALRSLAVEIGLVREGLELLASQTFQSPLLAHLIRDASSNHPPAHLRKLERLLKILAERDKEWFYAISRALLIGTLTFLQVERWRMQHAADLRRWLAAWGEFEALLALSNYAYEHPKNTFPELSRSQIVFEATGLSHPLLPEEHCVRNDVALNSTARFYIVSGSNMAGKSTLLRAIGLNAVLAYAAAPVVAERALLARFSICASIGVQDSLLDGKSKFLAEIERLKQALNIRDDQRPVLFLIDEMLAGTNSSDRQKVAEAVLVALVEQGAVGAISTHDLALTALPKLTQLRGRNVHMASRSASDPLDFDFLVKPGRLTQSSAQAIANSAGLPLSH